MRILVLAYGIKKVLSGRFKLLLNWSKGLNAKLVIANSNVSEKELHMLNLPQEYYNITKISDLLDLMRNEDYNYIFVDDRDILLLNRSDISNILKSKKVITYVYPIKGLWALWGLPLRNVMSRKIKWGKLIGRLLGYFILKNYAKIINKYSDIIVAQSYTASGILRYSYGIFPDLVLYNPVDRNIFSPRVKADEKFNSDYVVLYLGSGDGDTDISVLGKLCNVLRQYRLKVYTFGDRQKLKYLKNCDFEYLELIPEQKLSDLYSKSKFTIVPQVDEPIGYVTLESISTGTPIISLYPDEGIVNGYNGLYGSDRLFIILLEKFINEVLTNFNLYNTYYTNAIKNSEKFDMTKLSRTLTTYLMYTDTKFEI